MHEKIQEREQTYESVAFANRRIKRRRAKSIAKQSRKKNR